MPQRNLTVIVLAGVLSLICYKTAQRNRYASTFVEALEIVEQQALEEYSQRELFNAAMNGMLQSVDEHSAFIPPKASTAFKESLEQEFVGIGITAGLDPETNQIMVLSPTVGTPAYRAGLQSGDLIVEINKRSTAGLTLDDAIDRLRGEQGTTVNLTLARRGRDELINANVERQPIMIESVQGDKRNPDGTWNFYIEGAPNIGYLRLTSFGEESTNEMSRTLSEVIPRSDALILDLRDNSGGLLTAAIEIADMFLDDDKLIVSTRNRFGKIGQAAKASSKNTIVPKGMPMIVLINRYSASASEILSAALQDHERAVVIGERSWGKGTVQNVIEMENGRSMMKLTTASYWRPSGQNIHRKRDMEASDVWGVSPNDGLKIELTTEEFQRWLRERRERDFPGALVRREPETEPDNETATPNSNPSNNETEPDALEPDALEPSASDSTPSESENPQEEPASSSDPGAEQGMESEPRPDAAAPQSAVPVYYDPQLQRALEYLQNKLSPTELAQP